MYICLLSLLKQNSNRSKSPKIKHFQLFPGFLVDNAINIKLKLVLHIHCNSLATSVWTGTVTVSETLLTVHSAVLQSTCQHYHNLYTPSLTTSPCLVTTCSL